MRRSWGVYFARQKAKGSLKTKGLGLGKLLTVLLGGSRFLCAYSLVSEECNRHGYVSRSSIEMAHFSLLESVLLLYLMNDPGSLRNGRL